MQVSCRSILASALTRCLAVALTTVFVAAASLCAQPSTGTLLNNSTLYPRLVRLAHGAQNGTIVASTNGSIFKSTDNGNSWSYLGIVPTASGSSERCCATLYEMPQAVGSLAAGTLLSAASYFYGSTPAIEIYVSTNYGQSWQYWSTPVVQGDSNHGLWEPQFTIASDGALVMFWSDETDPCCSQKLAQIRTYDGVSWQNQQNTVASTIQSDRPGMAVVTKLPSGTYFMSYELCGPAACTVFERTSSDGWNWGTASNMGTKVQSYSGQWFEHAPTNTWSPSVLSSNGAILLIGQVLYESNGSVSSYNGKVIFVNLTADGSGPWYTIQAPVQIPNAYDNYCPNYSSALLPATDGSNILELASAYNSSGVCLSYYGAESWNNVPANGSTHALRNLGGNLCLDDYGWGTANNTSADLWTCTGSVIQEWALHNLGSGYFTLQNANTGLCVDNTGGSTTPGNLVTLWACTANNPNQNWRFLDYGNGTYMLQNQASGGLNLDDPGDSTNPGTQLQIWTDNGELPQQWMLQ